MNSGLWAVGPRILTAAFARGCSDWGGGVECFETLPPLDAQKFSAPAAVFWFSTPPAAMGAPTYPTRDTWERLALLQPFDLALDGLGERAAERLHLPLVLSARGLLYAEAIGEAGGSFWQPEPLSDQLRQPLYRLARSLLFGDASPPSPGVYLASFAFTPGGVRFERLCPFPNTAALVSLTSQVPDLFTCHWRSALGLPVVDLRVLRPTAARLGKALPATMALAPEAELLLEGRLLTVQGPSVASARRALSAAAVH